MEVWIVTETVAAAETEGGRAGALAGRWAGGRVGDSDRDRRIARGGKS